MNIISIPKFMGALITCVMNMKIYVQHCTIISLIEILYLERNWLEEQSGDKVLEIITKGVCIPAMEVNDLICSRHVNHHLCCWQQ